MNKTSADTIISSYSYAYDKAKNLIYKEETESGADKGATKYTYDEANRLKTVTEPSNKQTSYTYDKAGNRKTETVTESGIISLTTYNYNEQERLTDTVQTVGNTKKTVTYNYDNNGNIHSKFQGVEKSDDGEETELEIKLLGLDDDSEIGAVYEYDVFNRLVKTYQGSNVISNVYNGEGNRVSKTVNGNTCKYLYEYDKIVLETDGDGNQTARNVYGTNLITRESNDKKYTYHYNGHGDVTALTEKSGNIAAAYEYDPFGNITGETGDIENPYRYSGYEYDNETELYYLKSRFYDAETARFIQEDTYRGDASDPLSLNLYTYCANNPMIYLDPSGHSYYGTQFNNFDEFYEYTKTNPQEAQQMLYDLNVSNPEYLNCIINDYVTRQGEMKKGDNNVYQVIYGAMSGDSGAENSRDMHQNSSVSVSTNPNMYDDYTFTIFDALNWLIQTGGSGNFVLQTRATKEWSEASSVQKVIIGLFMDASNFLKNAGQIEKNINPKLFIGSTETSGRSAIWIYNDIMGTDWLQGASDMIGGIYYGYEDATNVEEMREVSTFIHEKGKELIWIPYFTDENMLDSIFDKAKEVDSDNNPLFDVIIIQPGAYYDGLYDKIDKVFDKIKKYNGKTRIGMEIEFDMGLVTGRRNYNWKGREYDSLLTSVDKRKLLKAYLTKLDELKSMGVPIGVYSGGPNEQGYNDINFNRNTHNSGNHIPYWEGIVEDWYATGVHYRDFPNSYNNSNLIYDINDYIYGNRNSLPVF